MIQTLRQFALGTIAAWSIIAAQTARGSDFDSATSLYGQGVHAYFAGDASQAEALLSRALTLRTDDPRPYYFRALSRLRLGRVADAEHDMSAGAAVEAQRPNRFAVGAALQRVQGGDRLLLERFRQQALAQAARSNDQAEAERHRQILEQDASVLRQPVVVPLEEYSGRGLPRALTADELARRAATSRPTVSPPQPAAVTEPPAATATAEPIRAEAAEPAARVPLPPQPEPTAPAESPPAAEEDPFRDFE